MKHARFIWLLLIGYFLSISIAQAEENTIAIRMTGQTTQLKMSQVAQNNVMDTDYAAIIAYAPPADSNSISNDKPSTFYQRARSYGTHPESDPPRYARNLAKTGIDAFKDLYWLDLGLDYRVRHELRHNDIRRNRITTDHPVLLRARAYVGIREILDPLRLVVEFEDARRYNGRFPKDNRDWNACELIQTYGELYFKEALGQDDLGNHRPIRIRGGRMAWEAVDRRLLANNQWRNTTNNFEGFRVTFGQEANDWEIDTWAMQPVRLLDKFDRRNKNLWFYGAVGHWRKWSDIVTLQPYYMGLVQDDQGGTVAKKEIHSPAIRAYGVLPNTRIDFDLGAIYQFGRDNGQKKTAWSYLLEFGYTFQQLSWKPRLSAFYGFVSGDRNPDDNLNNRFERFFGFARPWSANDYLVMENIKAPKIRVEFEPHKDLKIDGGYDWFWLASNTDRFNNLLNGSGGNRDRTGNSGDFLGHAIDFRAIYKLMPHVSTTVGYSHWFNGEFVKKRQLAQLGETTAGTNFFYIEVTLSAFN
ncbi:alginate export family protein [Nitrosomonas sp. ANs5]|uniref:alginate export family protein n=1 Tax=Nitrosomonas sp. ANs5 TaxID=3423941 RepID=UPI003D32E95F